MNILVIGSGGREHALCWKLKQSTFTESIYCAPGNGGTSQEAVNVELDVAQHKKVTDFCKEKNIDLVVVGPEAPLALGMADDLERAGIKVFGPSYAGARMESSKIFAKELMGRYNIPTAAFRIFEDFKQAEEYINSKGAPIVVKAYGLAAGKGVIIAETIEDAVKAAEDMLVKNRFGSAGQKIIVEEFLTGEEASILIITDGTNIIPLVTSQDHKRVYDGDKGPNTGGMGAYSPAPIVSEELFDEVMEKIARPTIDSLRNEGITYKGVLYIGLMITDAGVKVLEYNVRFGDPETQVVVPRLKSDLAELLMRAAEGDISGLELEWDKKEYVCVVCASAGYPGDYDKGKLITGLDEARKLGALVFHAGTQVEDNGIVTFGGRVLNVVGCGEGIQQAIENTYKAVKQINFEGMHFRKDIGHRAVANSR
ncbi:MAG: phosphoribosylamine--glycine ligase [Candidatus Omnitrophota bacterium]